MRAVLVGPYTRERGLTTMIRQLAHMLVKRGYDVTVHATSRAELWGDEDWLVLQNGAHEDNYDLAIVPELWGAAASLARVRRRVWIPMAEYLIPKDLQLYRAYSHIVAPTQMAREWLIRMKLPCTYIPWEVPPGGRLVSYDTPCKFIHFTRSDNHKKSGTDLMLQAWAEYAPRIDGTLTVKCIGQPKGFGVPDGVMLDIESYPTLDQIYAEHDVVVQPTRREGIGLHVLEARARGLVTLVTSHTTLAEFTARDDWILPSKAGRAFKAIREREIDIDALGELLVKVSQNKHHYVKDALHIASFADERYAEWEKAWGRFLSGA